MQKYRCLGICFSRPLALSSHISFQGNAYIFCFYYKSVVESILDKAAMLRWSQRRLLTLILTQHGVIYQYFSGNCTYFLFEYTFKNIWKYFKRFDSVLKRGRIARVYFKFAAQFQIFSEYFSAIFTLTNARGQRQRGKLSLHYQFILSLQTILISYDILATF